MRTSYGFRNARGDISRSTITQPRPPPSRNDTGSSRRRSRPRPLTRGCPVPRLAPVLPLATARPRRLHLVTHVASDPASGGPLLTPHPEAHGDFLDSSAEVLFACASQVRVNGGVRDHTSPGAQGGGARVSVWFPFTPGRLKSAAHAAWPLLSFCSEPWTFRLLGKIFAVTVGTR